MIRFSCAVACFLVAIESAEKAAGIEPQVLLAPDMVGAYWFVAAGWLLITILVAVRGVP